MDGWPGRFAVKNKKSKSGEKFIFARPHFTQLGVPLGFQADNSPITGHLQAPSVSQVQAGAGDGQIRLKLTGNKGFRLSVFPLLNRSHKRA